MPVDEKSCGNNRLKIVLWIVGSVLGIMFFFGSWVMGQTGQVEAKMDIVEINTKDNLDKHVAEFRPRVDELEESMVRQEVIYKNIEVNQKDMKELLKKIERK